MNIAICLFGEYREFYNTLISYKHYDLLKYDFYVSTWSMSKQVRNNININVQETITEELIRSYLPNVQISIRKPIKFEDDDVQLAMNYHQKKLGEMLKKSNKHYDIVLLKRMDTYIIDLDEDELKKCNTPNSLWVRGSVVDQAGIPFIDDTTFLGSYDSILYFIDKIPNETFETHYGLADLLNKLNLKINSINSFDNYILRPNMRPYLSNDHFKNTLYLKENWLKMNEMYCNDKFF